MDVMELTQGDDWELDGYLERYVGGEWVPESLDGKVVRIGVKGPEYQLNMTLVPVDTPGGQFRALAASAVTAEAPVGTLRSNVEVEDGGKKSSSRPYAIRCIEDYTP